jgi:HlyD family secretion protein
MGVSLKRGLWVAAAAFAVLLLVRAFRPVPVLVDVAPVQRGTLTVTVDDDGFTRVRERYTISAPVEGRLLRPPLDPGDDVQAGDTVVAEFVPVAAGLLDPRSRQEAQARLLRAQAAFHEAEARREQAAADLRYAEAELERVRELVKRKFQAQEALDEAVRDEQRAREGLRAASFAVQVTEFERDVAEASLREVSPEEVMERAGDQDGGEARGDRVAEERRVRLRSPITGTVLRVFEESTRTLTAGTPILEVGNTGRLEVVADYLSQDAVKVRSGMTVLVEGWGGELPSGEERVLMGRVRVVEPGGFTKTSALGVEEQRVNVIVDPAGDEPGWIALGDGYRVELRIVLLEAADALIVPMGALFREGDVWSAFVVERGKARKRTVEIGPRSGLEAQVLGGLDEGERVVLYPSNLVADGTPIEPTT